VPTAILSNIPRDVWHYLEGQHAWIRIPDVTTLSFRLGAVKPDPALYCRCLEALSVEPSKALYIDDREENVAAALRLGIRGWHYMLTDARCIPLTLMQVRRGR
jgi:putative hydrolase of the HAD superfamily